MRQKLMTADEIYNETMRHVVRLPSQERYARELSKLFHTHLCRLHLMDRGALVDELPHPAALVVAGTGQGKTMLIRAMANTIGVGCVSLDGSRICREGWKGGSIGEYLLAAKATMSKKDFDDMTLFIDEVDKLCLPSSASDSARAGDPMPNLLSLFESQELRIENPSNHVITTIDISRWTIILAGAFEGLDAIVKQRLSPHNSMGLTASREVCEMTKAQLMQQVTLDDLASYGMMPELLGRIGLVFSSSPLCREDYILLLKNTPGSLLEKYQEMFKSLYGVRLDISAPAADRIADLCMASSTGARALNPILHRLMMDALSTVSADETINSVVFVLESGEPAPHFYHGTRKTAIAPPPKHPTITALTAKELTKRLCGVFLAANGESRHFPIVEAFLQCSLCYWDLELVTPRFSMRALNELLKALGGSEYLPETVYGSMIQDSLNRPNHSRKLDKFYHHFSKLYNSDTRHELADGMALINQSLEKLYGDKEVEFLILAA